MPNGNFAKSKSNEEPNKWSLSKLNERPFFVELFFFAGPAGEEMQKHVVTLPPRMEADRRVLEVYVLFGCFACPLPWLEASPRGDPGFRGFFLGAGESEPLQQEPRSGGLGVVLISLHSRDLR